MKNIYIPKEKLSQYRSLSIMKIDFGFTVLFQNDEYQLVWKQVAGETGEDCGLTPPKKSLEELEVYCSIHQADILFDYFGPDETVGITDDMLGRLTMI